MVNLGQMHDASTADCILPGEGGLLPLSPDPSDRAGISSSGLLKVSRLSARYVDANMLFCGYAVPKTIAMFVLDLKRFVVCVS
ncbi:MAG: hypothetical protein Ct9H300mP8_08180 [Gammaproteobacteria bacterium]|nr:MAG: hypothetical protein Ct9H300mP8_08180 [Gammaproteobacteria bacterium]